MSRAEPRVDLRPEPRLQPAAPASPVALQSAAPQTAGSEVGAARTPLFDASGDADALGVAPTLHRIAELVAYANTATPLTVGILGDPGSGRSAALGRIGRRLGEIAAAARGADVPYVARLHLVAVDAAALEGAGAGELALSLAGAVHAALRKPYPALAREAGDAILDPHAALRQLGERLDDARRRLDGERRGLDEAESRRARLVETVLYDGAGSQVDAFARAERPAIERRLAAFGIAGEPLRAFKELVHDAAAPGGRAALVRRSLLGYAGQGRLLAWTAILLLAAVGLGIAFDAREGWLAELRAAPRGGAATADWLAAHAGWLLGARKAAFAGAALALAAWGWRAAGFITPVAKGARLLALDLDGRRRDLDGLVAHGTKRVDALDGEVERLSRAVAEAEARTGGEGRHEASPFAPAPAAAPFFAKLSAAITRGSAHAQAQGSGQTGAAAPQRLVLSLDNLDALAPERAGMLLDAANRLAGPGLVLVAAADPARLDSALAERCIGVPLRLGTPADRGAAGAVAAGLLGRAPAPASEPVPVASTLDGAVSEDEAAMLVAVAPLAGTTPRAVRRFLTLYRLARPHAVQGEAERSEIRRGALALSLALAEGGTAAEREGVAQGLGSGSSGFEPPADASPRLRAAIIAASRIDGGLSEETLGQAAARASRFGFGRGARPS